MEIISKEGIAVSAKKMLLSVIQDPKIREELREMLKEDYHITEKQRSACSYAISQ